MISKRWPVNKFLPLRLICLILIASGSAVSADLTNTVKVESVIDSVIVYNGLALVGRKATVRLEKGRQTLVVEHLPQSIMIDSLNFKISGAKVLDVRTEKVFLLEARQAEVRQFAAEIDKLKAEDSGLRDRELILKSSLDLLGSFDHMGAARVEADLRFAKVSLEDWQKMIDFTEKGRDARLKELRDTDQRRTEIAGSIAILEKKIDQIAGPRFLQLKYSLDQGIDDRLGGKSQGRVYNNQSFGEFDAYFKRNEGDSEYRVLITLDAGEAKNYGCDLKYTIPNASWNPLYDVRAYPGQGKVEVAYQAMVKQITGEAWNDISLVLSTARPTTGMTPPGLSPWLLDVYNPQYGSKRKSSMAPEAASAPAAARMEYKEEEDTLANAQQEPPPPVAEQRATSVVFPIRTRSTVPSSQDGQKVTIDSFSVSQKPVKFEYYTVPEVSDKVFLSVNLTNQQSYPWLPGKANVFIDNDMIGSLGLPDVQANGDFRLFLGIDDSISAKKQLVKKFTDTKGNSVEVSYFYRITVKNLKDKPVTLIVRDGLPLSRSDDIKVKIDSVEPQPVDTDDEEATTDWQNGLRRWVFELSAGQEKTIEEKYSVRYTTDKPAYPLK